MRNPPSQDCSPRKADPHANTSTSPQASRPPIGGDRFEGPLPPEALEELLRRRRTPKSSRQRTLPPWLIIAVIAVAQALLLAAALWVLLEPVSHPSSNITAPSSVRHQTPAPVPASTPAVSLPSSPPVVQSPQIYTEWVRRGSQAGFILCYGDCTPARSDFFLPDPVPHALPAVPRAKLVSMPVRRAELVQN